MKLWILRPMDGLPEEDDPWKPMVDVGSWYDKAFGFVVRAETELDARMMANLQSGDEKDCNPWLNERYSVCKELTSDGPEGVILRDFASV